MSSIVNLLTSSSELLWTVVTSAVVSALVGFYFKRKEIRVSAEVLYEFEQKKKVAEAIGRHHGPVLNSAARLSNRLGNLETFHDRGWTDFPPKGEADGYYFSSLVLRFMEFYSQVLSTESEAIVLDARSARPGDFEFMNYVSAFQRIVSDVQLFDGTGYDVSTDKDHFYADSLRLAIGHYDNSAREAKFALGNNDFFTRAHFEKPKNFFAGLKKEEQRLRWDRVISLHLLLACFLDRFGYEQHRRDYPYFLSVAKNFVNLGCLRNFLDLVSQYGLGSNDTSLKLELAVRMAIALRSQP